jgi:dihydrofolate reductase
MRKVRYQVACSLDGFISGPKGEIDWIPMDPDIDFRALYNQFDTLLMGRRTFEDLRELPTQAQGMDVFVFSRTLRQKDHPEVTVVSGEAVDTVRNLRLKPGKDIWLFGGGEFFRSLLSVGYVDTVEPAIVPVLLGKGRQLLPTPAERQSLALTGQRIYKKSGIILLTYDVIKGKPKND